MRTPRVGHSLTASQRRITVRVRRPPTRCPNGHQLGASRVPSAIKPASGRQSTTVTSLSPGTVDAGNWAGGYRYSFGPGGPRVRVQRPLGDVGVLRLLAQQVQGDVSLRGAARADWRGDSGINQAPTCQVADCGGDRERLGRHRRGGCRGGRSATGRDRHRKPDDYRRNRHDNDAAVGGTDGERQPTMKAPRPNGF